jgi:antitoxin (DNA-binding transcriptional repressor) of toxin-antitoxin stability system
MNERLAKRIQSTVFSTKQDIEHALVETLVDIGGQPHTVRSAKNSLSAVLGKAKKGEAQLIGKTPEEMTVVMSLKDLVDVVSAAAKPQTLGESLRAMGFEPAKRSVTLRPLPKTNRLTRYRETDAVKDSSAV